MLDSQVNFSAHLVPTITHTHTIYYSSKCPPVPFEVVSILDDIRRERGVYETVKLLCSVPVPFPFAGPPAAKVFKPLLKEQNIEYMPDHVVMEVKEGGTAGTTTVVYKVLGNGEKADEIKEVTVDLLLCTFPQRAPDFCRKLCNDKGYIDVDLQTNIVTTPKGKTLRNVYAIGDACWSMLPLPKSPHPKAGEFAYMMGLHVADQIVAKVTAGDETTTIPPPKRIASCVAECGIDGKGINISPDLSAILEEPSKGLPKFEFPFVDNAADEKKKWINKYIDIFFGEGKVTPFG